MLPMDIEFSGPQNKYLTPVSLSKLCVFFETLDEWCLCFTNVCVTAVVVTRDVVNIPDILFYLLGALPLNGGC